MDYMTDVVLSSCLLNVLDQSGIKEILCVCGVRGDAVKTVCSCITAIKFNICKPCIPIILLQLSFYPSD